ncbi:hypothetical protein [Streptomyces lacrimifluminis]|uniref:hypothetical protein n=1 Tax=Streptomyces lacrimifluminis TaxID=1500077 RepID=UPI0016695F5A|nr:hypothetical protein [Streptomyces lacrimifluminis]
METALTLGGSGFALLFEVGIERTHGEYRTILSSTNWSRLRESGEAAAWVTSCKRVGPADLPGRIVAVPNEPWLDEESPCSSPSSEVVLFRDDISCGCVTGMNTRHRLSPSLGSAWRSQGQKDAVPSSQLFPGRLDGMAGEIRARR